MKTANNKNKQSSLKNNFMKRNLYLLVIPVAGILFSCGGDKQTEEAKQDSVVVTKTDTVTNMDTVVRTVTADVDTAAIIAAYEAAYAKTKSNKKPEYKETKKHKMVAVYTEPEIESKAPVNQTADVAGYNYKPDKNATYPGTKKAFDEYFYKNFEYPDDALDNNIQGTIYAEIFINEKGVIDKVEFPGHKLGYGLEEEARRVIMGAKQLDPAIKNGVAVRERYVLPIRVMIKE
jgi:protein TonB